VRDSVTFNDAVQVPSFDVEASKALHAKLFGWAARSLAPIKSLTVVSGGTLGSIPFSLLLEPSASGTDYRSMPWLIKSTAVSHMPSIASWYAVSSNSTPVRSGSFIAWADPDFSGEASGVASTTRSVRKAVRSADQRGLEVRPGQLPANLGALLPALPETKAEAQAVARALKASAQSDVVAGGKATRASVIAVSESGALAQKGVVMFATHGLAPAQVPGLFQPALAMAREPGSTQPSLLQLDDVVGLRMNADWVLLSACNTASADRAGGDSMSGLARGFFFAGARSLLVTHWEVESESAAAITTKTMERYAANTRLTRAQALQQTAIELIEARQTPADWAHPAFWSAYALVGDGRRSATTAR
jgi:CHAT domain-containing protein